VRDNTPCPYHHAPCHKIENGQRTTGNIQRTKENPVMTTVQPVGEDLRKAVKWISEERKFNPEAQTSKLIEEACLKFDLSPMDAEYLLKILKKD
jgi:hypothetical protein